MLRPAAAPPKITGRRAGTEPYIHGCDEVIAFIRTNHDNPYNLGAEVELGLGDEIHRAT